ncbi:MAG: hypothetical protein ACJ75L_10515 [Gaiellaceae bacterium]
MRIPFFGARSDRRRGGVARGRIPLPGEPSLGERLRELGVPLSDTTADSYAAGRFGMLRRGGGAPHGDLVAGGYGDCGGKVVKAPSLRMDEADGFTWNGPKTEGDG